MKKIGILTFHFAVNYGAILQAYALQQFLKFNFPDYDVKIIDFKTAAYVKAYAFLKRRHPNWIKNIIVHLLFLRVVVPLSLRKKRFDRFVKDHLHLTKCYKSEEEFLANPPEMDVYITGSDQVFNPWNLCYKPYYLAFDKGEGRKIAYAPSFGRSEFCENIKKKVQDYILDFDCLSCREMGGARFIADIVGHDVPVVLDPVFLLDKRQWNEIAIAPNVGDRYIFIYDLNGGNSLITMAKEIAKKTGLKIICLTQKPLVFPLFNMGLKVIRSSGPREFLGLIRNAEFVVTDSFHGTALSVVLGTPFFVYIATPHSSSRIRSLLNSLCMKGKIVENGQSEDFVFQECLLHDYSSSLNNQRNESISYLKTSISHEN